MGPSKRLVKASKTFFKNKLNKIRSKNDASLVIINVGIYWFFI